VATVRKAHARIGGLVKNDAGPEEIEEARRELKAIKAEEYIREVVESAPPLTLEQIERLRALLPIGRAD
jgi:hypothetical protein